MRVDLEDRCYVALLRPAVSPCRGQDCHNLISDVHPLQRGRITGQSCYKGTLKHQHYYGNDHQQLPCWASGRGAAKGQLPTINHCLRTPLMSRCSIPVEKHSPNAISTSVSRIPFFLDVWLRHTVPTFSFSLCPRIY